MHVQDEHVVFCKDHTPIIKGKRTKRQRQVSPLRLTMSSSTCSSVGGIEVTTITTTTSPTTSIHELRNRTEEEEEDMANCLILLAQGHCTKNVTTPSSNHINDNKSTRLEIYQCKTCDRVFPSFQALGGHRASHKKLKATNGIGIDELEKNDYNCYDPTTTSTILSLQIPNRPLYSAISTKSKVHQCSICGVEFSSGQALGGHMRRHRSAFVGTSTTTTSMSSGNVIVGSGSHEIQEAKKKPRNVLKLDLNLPAAPEEDDHRESNKFSFRENMIVFSTSSLVDCHY